MPAALPDPDDDDPKPEVKPRDPLADQPFLTARHVDNLIEALRNQSRHTAALVDVQQRIQADARRTVSGAEKLNESTVALTGATRELGKLVEKLVASNTQLIDSNTRLMHVLKGEKTCDDSTPSGRRKRAG